MPPSLVVNTRERIVFVLITHETSSDPDGTPGVLKNEKLL